MKKYIPRDIEAKWQKKWQEAGIYKVDLEKSQKGKKFYLLVEFTYPSGDLHMGHWFAFAVPDILSRMKRMQGFEVFAPNGFDAFGLPAENAAIRKGIHPRDWTYSNIEKMKEQFGAMGASYDWQHQVITCDSDYYRWNQWIFLKMYEKGLAYRDKAIANWCPKDQCVLANENVENGKCWRCGSEVIQKEVEQWFLKITDYAEKLLWPQYKPGLKNSSKPGLEIADWPRSLKEGQNNWIGKSEGALINFPVADSDYQISVFTTRPDTLFGAAFLVLAPEHPFVASLLKSKILPRRQAGKSQKSKFVEIEEYIKRSQKKSELERKESKEKTGVFTGAYVINPVNEEKIPIWIADYVLMGYGTGAIMAVPAHDQRDFEFAKKYKLPVRTVILQNDKMKEAYVGSGLLQQPNLGVEPLKEAYTDEGTIINSGDWNGWKVPQDIHKVIDWLEAKGKGQRQTNYHLHDWSISRQRYWGTPIPVIYCDNCAIVPVPYDQLPVELPYEVDFAPRGKPPLATAEEWVKVKCPNCDADARREVETMDTFVDSSWYFLAYLRKIDNYSARGPVNSNIDALPFDHDLIKNWLPVDIYFGGAEHTLGHTLYSRFFVKFLQDIDAVPPMPEYAQKRVHHGVILGPNGLRMSKSRGNVVNPDEEVKRYGADSVRMYLAFLGPYDLVAPWAPGGIGGVYHFLERVWKLTESVEKNSTTPLSRHPQNLLPDDLYWMHKTIKKVTEDIENIKFNTAIAALMEWLNYLSGKAYRAGPAGSSSHPTSSPSADGLRALDGTPSVAVTRTEYETFIKLLAPFAPHITEELYQMMKHESSIHSQPWPNFDPNLARTTSITLVIQVNGKVRAKLPAEAQISKEEAEKLALSLPQVTKYLGDKKPQKTIFVPGRLINLVSS